MSMTVEMKFRNIRMSAQKLRKVTNGLYDSKLDWVTQLLALHNRKSMEPIRRAVCCATSVFERQNLLVSRAKLRDIRIDKAISGKTLRARAKGRVNFLERQSCHITMTLKIQQHGKES